MKTTVFEMFGKKKMIPLRTFTNGKEDFPPKDKWHTTLWVERGEDWYAIMSYGPNVTIRIIERDTFVKGTEVNP